MGRFGFRRNLSLGTAYGLLLLAISLGAFLIQSRLSLLVNDELPHDTLPIEGVHLTTSFLEPHLDVERLYHDIDYQPVNFMFETYYAGNAGRKSPGTFPTTYEVNAELARRFPKLYEEKKLAGEMVYLYTDIASRDIAGMENPRIFFHAALSPFSIYVNGVEVERRKNWANSNQVSAPILWSPGIENIRLVIALKNAYADKIRGIHLRYGLSVVPESYVIEADMVVRGQAPSIHFIAASFLAACSVFFFAMAFRNPHYADLWNWGTFCMLLALMQVSETYLFYFGEDSALKLSNSYALLHTGLCMSFAGAATTSFRLETKWAAGILGFSAIILSAVLYFRYPGLQNQGSWNAGSALAQFDALLFSGLKVLYAFILIVGTVKMFEQYQRFKSRDDLPMQRRMKIRAIEVLVIQCSFAVLIYAYGTKLIDRPGSGGVDFWLLIGLIPAIVLVNFAHVLMGKDSGFRQAFTQQMDYLDYFAQYFSGQDLERTFVTTLAVTDLAGYKTLGGWRAASPVLTGAIDTFVARIEEDLRTLKPASNIYARYKSNGDEFIQLIHAPSVEKSREILLTMLEQWLHHGAPMMAGWRQHLHALLDPYLEPEEVEKVAQKIDVHLLMSTCNDVKITAHKEKNALLKRPDFYSSRYIQLSEYFKTAKWNQIAMYGGDWEWLASRLSNTDQKFAFFANPKDSHTSIGFLVFGDHPWLQQEPGLEVWPEPRRQEVPWRIDQVANIVATATKESGRSGKNELPEVG